MSQAQKTQILKLAKGSWQQSILRNLISNHIITNPIRELRGNARKYQGRYQASFNSLLSRLRKAGYTITIQLGPLGGQWGAIYTLTV